MTPLSQSREDAQELNKPLVTPRTQIRIGNWNVRTMYSAGKSAQVARVMNQMKIQIAKTGKTKDNMEKDGEERKRKSGMEELE